MRLSAFLSVCAAASSYTSVPLILPEVAPIALDVGCGDGMSTRELAQKYPDHMIHGIDRDPVAIQKARRNFPGGVFTHKDLFDIPARPHFNIIQMKNVLNDIHDVEGTIHRIRRLLRPNGVFILSEEHAHDMNTLGIFYRSCSLSMGCCRECTINDDKAEFVFKKH